MSDYPQTVASSDWRPTGLPANQLTGIEVRRDAAPVAYAAALEAMNGRCEAIRAGTAGELIWLLEHEPVYTAGTSAREEDLRDPRFAVVPAGRGGKHTYHGPGQRICYVLVDLQTRARDVRGYVSALESWMIDTLADFGVEGWRSEAGIGIWVRDVDGREAKIGAIGVRVRRWVTMHGFSVNVSPDLSHFAGIVPCGIADRGVTSLARLGLDVSGEAWDRALMRHAGAFLDRLQVACPTENACSV